MKLSLAILIAAVAAALLLAAIVADDQDRSPLPDNRLHRSSAVSSLPRTERREVTPSSLVPPQDPTDRAPRTAPSGDACAMCARKDVTLGIYERENDELRQLLAQADADVAFYRSRAGESLAGTFREGVGRRFTRDEQELIISFLIEPLAMIPEDWQMDEFLDRRREFRTGLDRVRERSKPMYDPASSTQFTDEDRAAADEEEDRLLQEWRNALVQIFGQEGQQRIYP